MNHIKFIQLFNLLSQKQQLLFERRILYKSYSKGEIYGKIFRSLKNNNYFKKTEIISEKIYDKLSNDLKIKKSTLMNKVTELLKFLESFLCEMNLNENEPLKNMVVLEGISKYNDRNYEYKKIKQAIKEAEFKQFYSDYYRDLQKAYNAAMVYAYKYGLSNEYIKYYRINFQLRSADYFIYLMLADIENITLKDYGKEYLTEIKVVSEIKVRNVISVLKRDALIKTEYFELIFLLFNAFNNNEEIDLFMEARKFHRENIHKFGIDLNTLIYQALINFCLNKINRFNNNYNKIVLDIIMEKFKNNIINDLQYSNYQQNNFRDYLNLALNSGEINWAKKLIKEFAIYLPESIRNDTIKLSIAKIHIEEKNYLKALNTLEFINKKNFFVYMDYFSIKIRSLYFLDEINDVENELKNLRSYVKYHKDIPGIYSEKLKEIIKDVHYLLKMKQSPDNCDEALMHFEKTGDKKIFKWILEEFKKFNKD